MDKVTRVGIDLAKKVFHVTAVDDGGTVLERKRLRRAGLQSYLSRLPTGCVIAMEACGGAHHWGRLAVRHGHRVLMMSPQFVVPYVKSNKNDVNDADAIAEVSARPCMRFVGVSSVAQEHIQQVHRARQMAMRNRVAQTNQIHGFLLEYGIEAPKGTAALLRRLAEVLDDARFIVRAKKIPDSPACGKRRTAWTILRNTRNPAADSGPRSLRPGPDPAPRAVRR